MDLCLHVRLNCSQRPSAESRAHKALPSSHLANLSLGYFCRQTLFWAPTPESDLNRINPPQPLPNPAVTAALFPWLSFELEPARAGHRPCLCLASRLVLSSVQSVKRMNVCIDGSGEKVKMASLGLDTYGQGLWRGKDYPQQLEPEG